MSFTDDSGQGPEVTDQSTVDPGNQPLQQEESYSPYAQNYLKNVPEAEREIVGRHIKQWDSGFTRHVQPLQAKIRQYESLGDPETLQQAHGLYQRVVNDPQGFAQALYEAGYAPTMKAAQQQVQQIQNEG